MERTTILIVEDQIDIAEWLQRILVNYGYQVPYLAFSGEQAIKRMASLHPDLVLMDINLDFVSKNKNSNLKRLDGIQTAEQIFKEYFVPIIFLTGSTDTETIDRAKFAGAYGFLTKPIDPLELKTTIDIILNKSQQLKIEKLKEIERSRYFVEGQEKERMRLSTELHEEIGTQLASLSTHLSAILNNIQPSIAPNDFNALNDLREQLNESLQSIRDISSDLAPATLINLGLSAAIRRYIKKISSYSDIEFELFTDELDEVNHLITLPVLISIYRIVVELLNNIINHANATHSSLTFQVINQNLEIELEDDGIGFDKSQYENAQGLGFMSIQMRLNILNGKIQIDTEPHTQSGAYIRICIPLNLNKTE